MRRPEVGTWGVKRNWGLGLEHHAWEFRLPCKPEKPLEVLLDTTQCVFKDVTAHVV